MLRFFGQFSFLLGGPFVEVPIVWGRSATDEAIAVEEVGEVCTHRHPIFAIISINHWTVMSHWSHGHFKPSKQRPPIEFLHYLPWLFIRRVWYIIFFVFFEVVWLLTTFFLQLLFCFFLFDNFFFYFVLRLKSSILHSHYLLIINHFRVQSGTQRRRYCHL